MKSSAPYTLPRLATWRMRCALSAVVAGSFFFIDHDVLRSRRMVEEREVAASSLENPFAVQQEDTTLRTAAAFFTLGGAGAACLLMRPLGRPRWRHALLALGVLYFGWCCLSLAWSENPDVSIRKITILGLVLLGAFGMAHQLEAEDVCWIAVLVLGGYLAVGYFVEFALRTFRPWESEYRFAGTVHPNDQGVISSLLILATIAAPWHTTRRPWLRHVIVGAALLSAWLTGSRTAFAAMLVGVLLAMTLRRRGQNRALIIAAATALASIGLIAFGFLQANAVKSTTDAAAMGRTKEVSSLSGRLPLWEALLHDASKHPVGGYGYGGYWSSKKMLDLSTRMHWNIPHAHNSYLELVLAGGVVLLSLYLIWAFTAIGTALSRFHRSNRPAELFLACVIVFGFVHSVAESKFPDSSIGTYIMFTAMASIAMRPTTSRMPAMRTAATARPWRLSPVPAMHSV